MRDIATRVGLNAASLYNHFPGKEALYASVLKRGLRPVFELLDALARSEWTPQRLDSATDALVSDLARRPQISRLLLQEALSGGEHLRTLAREWLRPLYARALATFQARSRILRQWDESDLPLLLMSFHHLVLSHFAVAPMLQEVLEENPLSAAGIERHRRFMRKMVQLWFAGSQNAELPDSREPSEDETLSRMQHK